MNEGEFKKRIKEFSVWVNCSEQQIQGRPRSFKIFDEDTYAKMLEDAQKEFPELSNIEIYPDERLDDIVLLRRLLRKREEWFVKWFGGEE